MRCTTTTRLSSPTTRSRRKRRPLRLATVGEVAAPRVVRAATARALRQPMQAITEADRYSSPTAELQQPNHGSGQRSVTARAMLSRRDVSSATVDDAGDSSRTGRPPARVVRCRTRGNEPLGKLATPLSRRSRAELRTAHPTLACEARRVAGARCSWATMSGALATQSACGSSAAERRHARTAHSRATHDRSRPRPPRPPQLYSSSPMRHIRRGTGRPRTRTGRPP